MLIHGVKCFGLDLYWQHINNAVYRSFSHLGADEDSFRKEVASCCGPINLISFPLIDMAAN